jgi:Peptidase C13 family
MKEVNAVSRLFRERFGAEGKIVQLVNNRKSSASSPLATTTSLRAALQRMAEVMDKDEDLLFLFLTTHGSRSHRLALDFWPLQLHELHPARLRGMLDESGVRNRVIVVSACYSGGFVDALRNEHTLVISASAPDKNSFGCSDEAEWTYFGKAYFDEALRKTHSFVTAFELAKPVIAEREREQGYQPSDPQMALGEEIKPKLLLLERQLAAR